MAPLFGQAPTRQRIAVTAADVAGRPVMGVRVELRLDQHAIQSGDTDELGQVLFAGLPPGRYTVSAKKTGFENLQKSDIDLSRENIALELTMVGALTRAESVEVRGAVIEVEENAS